MSIGDQPIALEPFRSGSLPAHLFCPPDGMAFDPAAYIALPAVGATSTVVSFTVDDGFLAALRVLGNVYTGVGFTEGSGALVWQLLDNGSVIRNYDTIVSSLGTVLRPVALGGGAGVLIQEGHAVALTVLNVSVNAGGGLCGGRLGGWYIPKWRMADEFAQF